MATPGLSSAFRYVLEWLRRSAAILTLRRFDTETAAGRSRERYRRAALSTIASSGAKAISLLTMVVSIPLTLGYLGSERFGMWMTLSALVTMLSFANLGLGNSLLNAVAHAAGDGDRLLIRSYVSSGLAVLMAVAIIGAGAFVIAYAYVDWSAVFNVDSATASSEAGPATAAFVACFLVGLPASAMQQVRQGLQEEYVNALFIGAGHLLGLATVVAVIQMQLGLPWLVLALAGMPVLAAIANALVLVARKPWLRPTVSAVTHEHVRSLLRVGVLFLVLQLAVAVAFASDSVVLAHVIGPPAVAEYAVVARLFSIPMLFVALTLGPIWPAYREAISRGDIEWVGVTFGRSVRLALTLAVPLSGVLVVIGIPVIGLWVGTETIQPSFGLVLAFGVWTVLYAFGTAIAMLLNGAQVVGFQVATAILMASLNIGLSIALASRIGVAGVVWASVIAYGLCSLAPALVYVPRVLRRIEGSVRLGTC